MSIENKEIRPDEFMDLRGISCPNNSARILFKLQAMDGGQILEAIIDDGEPIKNVPEAVSIEGHEIIIKEKLVYQWRVLIRKTD